MPPIWVSLRQDIDLLHETWQTEFKKRATGGVLALSGFHYQFLIALYDTLRAWLSRPTSESSSFSVFSECLTDIFDASANDVILLTQVKRSRRSETLTSALDELWLIYTLSHRITPQLTPFLRFRILSRSSHLKTFRHTVKHWECAIEGAEKEDIDNFLSRVEIELFSDPEDEILSILTTEFRATDPVGYVRRWLGMLLEASADGKNADFRLVSKSIWNDLQTLKNSSSANPLGIYIWTSEDRIPETIDQGAILTGEKPQIRHLRQGYFAPRKETYQPIVEGALEWLADLSENEDKQLRLPVFWIGGRSGSGKSVALIHVLSLLYETGIGPILWLGNKTDLLRDAVPWALNFKDNNRRLIIGIDDPYAPNTQNDDIVWKEVLADLESARQAGQASALPLIVCSGPTEQAERIKMDLPEDVSVCFYDLPDENRLDTTELRDWYRERTSKSPPNTGEENILLVQLFFEWETGQSLPEFAFRFRNRIRENDPNGILEELITRILCANRLYAGYPVAAYKEQITPDLQDTFERLRKENHFSQFGGERGIGLWFAHAHLSNVIYESWYPRENGRAIRNAHLHRVINDSFEYGASTAEKFALLWAISNLEARPVNSDSIVERLDRDAVIELLESVYESRTKDHGTTMPLSELPVWIKLHVYFSDAFPKFNPVDESIKRISVKNLKEEGLKLTCHKLLQYLSSFSQQQRTMFTRSLFELLTDAPQWYGWGPIAEDAYRRTTSPMLLNLIIDWVLERPNSRWAGRLFRLVFNTNPADPLVLDVAQKLLPIANGELFWGDIGLQLLRALPDEPVPDSVSRWARNNHDQWGAGYLLGKLLTKQYDPAIEWAFSWCEKWHRERSANYVLEPLLALVGQSLRLRDWCLSWIDHNFLIEDTGYLAEHLIKTYPTDEQILLMGFQWLENHSLEHKSWGFVWRALYASDPFEIMKDFKSSPSLDSQLSAREHDRLTHFDAGSNNSKAGAAIPFLSAESLYYFSFGFSVAELKEEEAYILKKVVTLKPDYAEAWQALGAVYNELNEIDLALDANLQLSELTPEDPKVWYYVSIAYRKTERMQESIDALKQAIELNPDYVDAWQSLGAIYNELKEVDLALAASLKVAELAPDSPDAWYYLSISYGKAGRQKDQVDALNNAVKMNPEFAEAWKALGAIHAQLKEVGLALVASLKVTELTPDDPYAWYYLSISYSRADQKREQITSLEKALELNPDFAEAWRDLGAARYHLARSNENAELLEDSISALKRAVELKPDYIKALQVLGSTYKNSRQYPLALEVYLKLVKLTPHDRKTWYNLALVHLGVANFEEAVVILREIIAHGPDGLFPNKVLSELAALVLAIENKKFELETLAPREFQHFYYSGIRYFDTNDAAQAANAFSEAIEVSPDPLIAKTILLVSLYSESIIAFHLKSYQRVIELLNNLNTIATDIPSVWLLLSVSYRKIDNAEAALEAAKRARDLAPSDASTWYQIGKCYAKLNVTDNAIIAYNEALKLDEYLKPAREELRKIMDGK